MAYETSQGALQLGPRAGHAELAAGLGPLGGIGAGGLAECRHMAWLVERASLTAAHVAEHGIVLPETLLDSDAHPGAHRWLREQPLLAVSGVGWERLAETGVRVVELDLGARESGTLGLRILGPESDSTRLSLPLAQVNQAAADASRARAALDVAGDPSPLDRLLSAVVLGQRGPDPRPAEAGCWTAAAVVSALAIRELVEEGYGYPGQLVGAFRPIDEVEAQLALLDARIEEVAVRAEGQRPLASRVDEALGELSGDTSSADVERIGSVRKVVAPELLLRLDAMGATFVEGGDRQSELRLPPVWRWQLPANDGWVPSVEFAATPHGGRARASGSAAGLVVAVIVAVAIAVVIGVVAFAT